MLGDARDERLNRKLTVILAADVAGYSMLVGRDEEATIRRLSQQSAIFKSLVTKHDGRVFNTAGDAILAEFASAVQAVRCAIDVQEASRAANRTIPADEALLLRIGIAIGDVIVAENGDLLGDGVNIAARLEGLAEPGGVCISQDVQNLVQNKIALSFDSLGQQDLKNIERPITCYRIILDPTLRPARSRAAGWRQHTMAFAVTGLAGLALAAWLVATQRPHSRPPVGQGGADGVRFDAARVPLVTDEVRSFLARAYLAANGAKALAISNDGDHHGIAVNAPSADAAREKALASCQSTSHRPCWLYASGDHVHPDVKPIAMPAADEIPMTGLGMPVALDAIPLTHGQQASRIARDYPREKGSKAIAIGMRGTAGWVAMSSGRSAAEAVRRALEFCGFRTGRPCIVYAIGDEAAVRLPRTRPVVGVFTFAGDATMPEAEKQRLARDYRDGGWRAIARGGNGTWHAEVGAASEVAAIDGVLARCRAVDRDCDVYAIDRFLAGRLPG